MKRRSLYILVFFGFLAFCGAALGAELHVPSEYPTIQAAVDDSNDGDVVIVADGVYKGYRNCGIVVGGKVITIKSENGPENCIMDCDAGYYRYQGFIFGGRNQNSILDGFTIKNGRGSMWGGGGIGCYYSSPTIVNCIITNCGDSGIYIEDGSPTVRDCTIIGNQAENGGGISCVSDRSLIINCTINENTSGGIYCKDSSAMISGCTISDNTATGNLFSAGGIYCEASSATISGCTISGNTATGHWSASGIFCYEDNEGVSPVIIDCIITGNSGSWDGGGIGCNYSSPSIFNCTISDNSGGGIVYDHCGSAAVSGCIISGNTSDLGGGIYCEGGSAVVSSCIISGNRADVGAGVMVAYGANVTLTNCTIVDNVVESGGMIGGVLVDDGAARITNCIVWGNSFSGYLPFQIYVDSGASGEVTYCAVQDGFAGEGNIDAYPGFVSGWDYHLAEDSPCINAGDPTYVGVPGERDIDGERRVFGGRVDIGADEYIQLRPVADAGRDHTLALVPAVITLDGSGSYDPNGAVLIYRWRQIEGPAVELSDANAVSPTFVPVGFGVYAFELIVNNGENDSLPDVVGIVIGDNHAPIADGGPDRYAGEEPVVLDGTGSFDPDGYGIVEYFWEQVSGPSAVIEDANTASPRITFAQSDKVEKCRFELVVSDDELDSEPDSVDVTVVPAWGAEVERLYQVNPPFDPNKPTLVGFGGGYNCHHGAAWRPGADWLIKANVITFNEYHTDYFNHYGDKLIVYLSKVVSDYQEPIQTIGFSAGNRPAIDVANYINRKYSDPRYAVNRVTLLEEASDWCDDKIPGAISVFLANPVEGEQCWIDNYIAVSARFYPEVLNVRFPRVPPGHNWEEWWPIYHSIPYNWYDLSLDTSLWRDGDIYNGGLTAGAFLSVIGQGKNLQVATESADQYYFKWSGEGPNDVYDNEPDYMLFYDEANHPGCLPEPVRLAGPEYGATVDANGAVFTCEQSQHAVGYELWFGLDPYNMIFLVSDTAEPPNDVITTFPSEKTWWTIKARDCYGSTIHADASCINAEKVAAQGIENTRKRKSYSSIQRAINDASDWDEIVIRPGIYEYREKFNLRGRNITVRSADPEDQMVVGATIINGGNSGSVVTFCSGEDSNCVLSGLTITGGGNGDDEAGILCLGEGTTPTIRNCVITRNAGVGIYSGDGVSAGKPIIKNCIIAGNEGAGIKIRGTNNAIITNCTIVGNGGAGIDKQWGATTVTNCIIWYNDGDAIYPSGRRVTYSNIEGGWSGEGNIDADPCFLEAGHWDVNWLWVVGDYHLQEGSHCINAGDPNFAADPNETDIDGQPRVFDGQIDIGADEFVPPVEVAMHFTPKTLNPKSKGKWVKAHCVLPYGFCVDDVDVNSPAKVIEPFEPDIESEYIDVFINEDSLVEIEIGFEHSTFCDGIDYGPVEVTVTGKLTSGQDFYGTDIIRVINPNIQCLAGFVSHWLESGCRRSGWCGGADVDHSSMVDFIDFALLDGCCIEGIKE